MAIRPQKPVKKRHVWFQKFLGCCFGIDFGGDSIHDEWIFTGTYYNEETGRLQYEFMKREGNEYTEQYLTDYKNARSIMGAMIDAYKGKK